VTAPVSFGTADVPRGRRASAKRDGRDQLHRTSRGEMQAADDTKWLEIANCGY
jgi:hypothetical protein